MSCRQAERADIQRRTDTEHTVTENMASPEMAETEIFEENLMARNKQYSRRETYKHQALYCAKKFSVYVLSYVGLTCTVIGYSFLGGLIFMALEQPHEETVRRKVTKIRSDHVDELYAINDKYNVVFRENWTKCADEVLRRFQDEIYHFVQDQGWSGGDDVTAHDPRWSFTGSLLFSVTVITTIGYGFTAPKTVAGRTATMLYALIGIPLTFLCLTNIGKAMATCFRVLYGRTFCVSCRKKFFFRVVRNDHGSSRVAIDRMELQRYENHTDDHDYGQTTCAEIENAHNAPDKPCPRQHERTEVPIFVCLVLVVWYIIFGAILFTIWETSWDLFIGSYFCFITLSTIGFGDVVPGFSSKDWDDQVKQVACTMYLLIGLSMLAMCFDLMQQTGRGLAKRIAVTLHLVDKQ